MDREQEAIYRPWVVDGWSWVEFGGGYIVTKLDELHGTAGDWKVNREFVG